jgi:phospholipid N-methyltransferase
MNQPTTSHGRVRSQRQGESGPFVTFLREAARDPRSVGAVAPSGKALARALTEPLRARAGRPLHVLEAGAGTGAVTRVLMEQLPLGSRLDIAETNPRFADRLSDLVRTHPCSAGEPSAQVRVHAVPVERLETGRRYDVIVSGLPFTNFTPEHVEAIMNRYLELLHPGGSLTYFAYRGTRRARTLLMSRTQADRHRAVESVLAACRRRYATGRRTVWANLPPATVWQLSRPAQEFRHPGPQDAAAGVVR